MTQRSNYQRNPLNIGGPRWGGPPYNDINALRRANQDLRDSVHMLRRRLNGLLEERQRYIRYIHLDLFVKYKLEAEQKYKELEERYKQLEAEKKTAEEQKQEMENPKDASVKVKPDKEAQSQKGVEEMLEQECKHMKEKHKGEEEQLEQLKKNYEVLLQNYTNLMELHGQRKCSEQETDATKDQKNQEKQEKMEVEEKEKPEKKETGHWRLFRKFFAERGSEEGAGL